MERFDPIDIEFLINNAEVKADAKKVKDDIKGIGDEAERAAAKVGGKGGRGGVAEPMRRAGNAAAVSGRQAAAARPQWNGLGNSINQLSRELPAFTYSAQTGFLALSNNIPILADEIGRLKAQNDALVASGQKGVPIWKQLSKAFFSWNTLLSLGVVALTLYGDKIADFIGGLFKGKEAIDKMKESKEQLNKAFESNEFQKAVKDITSLRINLNLAKEGLLEKKTVVDQYNKSLGETVKKAKTLDEVEQGLIDNADPYIEMTLKKAAANLALEEAAKKAYEAAQLEQKEAEEFATSGDKILSNLATTGGRGSNVYTPPTFDTEAYKKSLKENGDKRKKAQIEQKEEEQKTLEEIAEQFQREYAEAYNKIRDPESTEPETPKILNDRKKLLEKIADLDREYAREKLNQDAEELQALRDKFSKVNKLIEEFNADPKNASKKIDITGLGVIQENAEADLLYNQDTRNLKEELEKQKKLYEEIEQYKATFGIEKTRERYGEQLQEFDTYAELLRSKIAKNKDAFDAVAGGTDNGGQSERVAFLKEQIKTEKRLEAKKYDELLAQLMDFQKKRQLIIEQYEEKRAKLLASGDFSEAGELEKIHLKELDKLGEEYAKNTDEYKALIEGVEGLSEVAARAVIANARRMVEALVAAGKLSDEAAREISAKINALEETVNAGPSQKLNEIAGQISDISQSFLELGDAVGYFDEGLGDTLTTMGELGNVASDVAGSVASFGSGDIVGGISGAISAIAGIFSIGARSRESERQARAELAEINNRIADGELRMNEILRERNILRAQEIELTLEGIAAQREALGLAEEQNGVDQAFLLNQLQNENYVSSSRTERYGGFLGIGRKTRVVNEYSSMLGLTFEEIEALYEEGRLEDRAKELFEQLSRLRDEGEDINGMLSDLEKQAQEIFTGTTSNAIADSIVEGLRQGHRSFEDFAGDIEGMLQNAILNAIKYQVLEEPLQNLYERFAEFAESEGELTEAEAQNIRNQYEQQVQAAIDQYEQWSQVLDQGLLEANGNGPNGLQGAIRRELTEETGSEFTGLVRGQFDIIKRDFQLHERHFEVSQQNLDATRRTMQYSALIEQNTASAVVQLQYAVAELKTLNNNRSQSARDLGLG